MNNSLEVISKTRVVPKSPRDVAEAGEKELEGGCYHRIAHMSTSTHTKMIFGLFLPSAFNHVTSPLSVMFWLSGLTCDDTNFAIKAGPKAFAAAESRVCLASFLDQVSLFSLLLFYRTYTYLHHIEHSYCNARYLATSR